MKRETEDLLNRVCTEAMNWSAALAGVLAILLILAVVMS